MADRLRIEKLDEEGKVPYLVHNKKGQALIGIEWDKRWKRYVIWTDGDSEKIYGTKWDGECLVELGKKMMALPKSDGEGA